MNVRNDCDDCKRLVEKYGEENLKICIMCAHYYYGEVCSCIGF